MSVKLKLLQDRCAHSWVRVATGRKVPWRYARCRKCRNEYVPTYKHERCPTCGGKGKRKKKMLDEVQTRCIVPGCGAEAPRYKRVVRLVVLNRVVECPYGFNHFVKRDEITGEDVIGNNLHDCYLDSITPGHRCVDPENTGATRCPHVKKLHEQYGWRTYYKAVLVEYARRGVLHEEYPMQLVYASLNHEGTSWMAVNVRTGQRFAVELRGENQEWTREKRVWYGLEEWSVVKRGPTRFTPEGEDIEQEYRITSISNPASEGMVQFTEKEPIWLGVPPRQQHTCNCINCQEYRRSRYTMLTSDEYEALSGVHIMGPKPDRPLVDPATAKSAPPPQFPIGDPETCIDCKYARCRKHRMIVKPRDPRVIAASRSTDMVPVTKPETRHGFQYAPGPHLSQRQVDGRMQRPATATPKPEKAPAKEIKTPRAGEMITRAQALTDAVAKKPAKLTKNKKQSKPTKQTKTKSKK